MTGGEIRSPELVVVTTARSVAGPGGSGTVDRMLPSELVVDDATVVQPTAVCCWIATG